MFQTRRRLLPGFAALLALTSVPAFSQTPEAGMMGRGHRAIRNADDLPAGRLRGDLRSLPTAARARAIAKLNTFEFPASDHASLHVDRGGSVLYVCEFPVPTDSLAGGADVPSVSAAPVPVSPFPNALKFSSRPGAANTLFLDFDGHVVTGTGWNDSLPRTSIPAKVFSTDSDYGNYSDAEQAAIKRVWQRVAEDFAIYDVNVTTVEPAAFNSRTGRVLITDHLDANGQPNPFENAGGVAYVGVFTWSNYDYYSPAWVYSDNLLNQEDYIAEAASHEFGHNLNLSHDGQTGGTVYYNGHGADDTSWGPIMGTGYGRNVSQWSKGEYFLSNNTQDDLSIMQGYLDYRPDDHGNSNGAATPLTVQGSGLVTATTPEIDPANTNETNKGLIEQLGDLDVFSFNAVGGSIRLHVNPWISPANTRGGNVDLRARLYDGGGALIAEANPVDRTYARIETTVAPGLHYLHISAVGVGAPTSSSPSGYTEYASRGQYFVTGAVVLAAATVRLEGNLAFGSVQVGSTHRRTLTLHNDNGQSVTVSGMSLPPGFSGAWTGAVPTLGSRDVPILFTPVDPTSYGSNLVVSVLGGGAAQTQTVSGAGADFLFLTVTNPPGGSTSVANAVESYDVHGTAGTDLQGQLRWTNLLNGASGSAAAQPNWSILAAPLGVGTNTLQITGTNAPAGAVVSSDAAGQAPYLDGWSTGDNGGSGWNAWILAASVSNAGHFRATSGSNSRLNIGPDAWGLWANSGSEANAYRPLGQPLRAGDTLRVTLENNWIQNGSSVGVALLNPAGEYLFEFYFFGGGATYTINDAVPSRNTGVGYTDTGLNLALTLTGSNTYQLVAGGATITGTFAPRTDLTPTRLRAWNFSAGPGEDYNLYLNSISVSNGPVAPTESTATAILHRLPAPASLLVQPVGFTETYGAITSLSVVAEGAPPLHTQWRKDGTDLAGQTNFVLQFSPLLRSDAGDYLAVVSNAYGSATSTVAAVAVEKADQTMSFPNPGSQVATNVVGLNATAISGLEVAYAVVSGPAVWNGLQLSFTGSGTVAVEAAQPGDDNWNPAASATSTFEVVKASATLVLSGLEQTYDGTLRGVSAIPDPPELNVNLTYDGTTNVPVNAGAYYVVATVEDNFFAGQAGETLQVVRASQVIDFPNPGDQLVANAVTLSGSASSGLPVQFGLLSGPAVLNETNLSFTGAGTVALAASQNGDLNWEAAQPVTNVFLVRSFADANTNNIPDDWELRYFESLTHLTPTSNYDGDFHLDREEYITGTDPTDPDSFFRVDIAEVLTDGPSQFGLRWFSVSNRIYRVERVVDVVSEYEHVSGDLPAEDPMNEFAEPPPDSDIFYYRVRVWIAP